MAKKDPSSGDPKDAEKNRNKPDPTNKPPPDAETGQPSNPAEPPWIAELPEETRRAIVSGKVDSPSPALRRLIERYKKWLLMNAPKPR